MGLHFKKGGIRESSPTGNTTPDFSHSLDPFRTFKVQILQLLLWVKRVFKIDIETCNQCGGAVKVIASIDDPAIIKRILDHLEHRADSPRPVPHPV